MYSTNRNEVIIDSTLRVGALVDLHKQSESRDTFQTSPEIELFENGTSFKAIQFRKVEITFKYYVHGFHEGMLIKNSGGQ